MLELSKKSFDILKNVDLSEMGGGITFHEKDGVFGIETTNFSLLTAILNDAIVMDGMDEDYNVTAYGRDMYRLYDELMDEAYNEPVPIEFWEKLRSQDNVQCPDCDGTLIPFGDKSTAPFFKCNKCRIIIG